MKPYIIYRFHMQRRIDKLRAQTRDLKKTAKARGVSKQCLDALDRSINALNKADATL